MREQHERVHGPYEHKTKSGIRWRVVIVGAGETRGASSRRSFIFETKDEAIAFVAKSRRELEVRTIDVAVSEYIAMQTARADRNEIAHNTVERDEFHLRNLLKLKEHGNKDLHLLTPSFGETLYERRGGAVDSHRNGLAVCRAFGRWCVKKGYLRVSPFADVKGAGKRKKGKPQLYYDDAKQFTDVCVKLGPGDDGAVLALSYLLLGTRAGEILDRVIRELDRGGTILWIPEGKTNAARRRVDIPEVLTPLLLRVAGGRPRTAPLFPHTARRARPADWAREQVTRICKLAGVPRMTPQALRGTCSSLGEEAGIAPQRIAELLGHATAPPAITTGGAYIDKDRASAASRARAQRAIVGN